MTTSVSLPDALPPTVAQRLIFRANGIAFTAADIAPVAIVGSREVHPGVATPTEIEETFRRARGLLQADALVGWLESWGIAPDDFRSWCSDVAAGTSTATLWCELLCSGRFERATAVLVTAAAAACELGHPDVLGPGFEPDDWTERLYAQRIDESRLESLISARRLDWTYLEATVVSTPERSLAEELRHQVLSDGVQLRQAALAARCTAENLAALLETISADPLRAALRGARCGEVVGPVPRISPEKPWTVVHLTARTEPALSDPAVRARAETALRNEVIGHAVARHVVA